MGSMAQSKRIQLAKAASDFARFAAAAGAGGCEHHAKAAYLRLTSSAFDELVRGQADVGVCEKAKKKRGNGSRCGEEEEESEDGEMEIGDVSTGEVVDSNIKRRRIKN